MNGSVDIPTIQTNIEWYLKENCHGKIDAMQCESLGDGALLLLLYRGGKRSALVFTKKELQSNILKGWERRFEEKLESEMDSKA
jgi:hypothetical protein